MLTTVYPTFARDRLHYHKYNSPSTRRLPVASLSPSASTIAAGTVTPSLLGHEVREGGLQVVNRLDPRVLESLPGC